MNTVAYVLSEANIGCVSALDLKHDAVFVSLFITKTQ